MSKRQYIGARYVPKFFDWNGSAEWRTGVAYEALTIVTRNGNSYTSKIPVPSNIGAPESNPKYWVSTGLFNEQMEQYRQEMENYKTVVEGYRQDTENYNTQVEQYRQETENVKINYSKCFNTAANMIADTSLKEGMTVKTLGYNKIDDNGGAFYKIYNTKEQNSEHYENLSNGKYALLVPNGYITPEMFGAIGDGVTDDTNAFISAINSRLPIKADNNKTYKISTINIHNSFLLIGGKYYSDSSNTIKEIFLINTGNIHVRIHDIEFTSVMDKPAVTFTDEVLSSNVSFIHNNGYATSDFEIYNSKISNCEFCLKSEEGGFRVINCDLINSMMPIFSNTTNIEIEDCYIESIATNSLYHCVYLHPQAIGENGYITNCSFVSKVSTALQCYNDVNTFNDELNNLFIENCTFKNSLDGSLTSAFGYNNCKPRFENCKLGTAYSGYYNNCICELTGLYKDAEITNSICVLNKAFKLSNSLSIADSVIEINGNVAYMMNIVGGTLKLINNIIKTSNTNNIIRLDQATVDLYRNIIERAPGTTANFAFISDADSVFTALDNICNIQDAVLGKTINTWLAHPDKFLPQGKSNAGDIVDSATGFYEFHTDIQGYKINVTFQSRAAQWTDDSTICTFKTAFRPATKQYVVLYDTGIKEAIVCLLATDGTLKVYRTTNNGTSGFIEGQFSFYTKSDNY